MSSVYEERPSHSLSSQQDKDNIASQSIENADANKDLTASNESPKLSARVKVSSSSSNPYIVRPVSKQSSHRSRVSPSAQPEAQNEFDSYNAHLARQATLAHAQSRTSPWKEWALSMQSVYHRFVAIFQSLSDFRVEPQSTWHDYFAQLLNICILYNTVMLPLRIAFAPEHSIPYFVIDYALADVMYALDVFFNSRTVFSHEGTVQKQKAKIMQHYKNTGGFKIHIFSTLPLEIVCAFWGGQVWIPLFRLNRIFRILSMPNAFANVEKHISQNVNVIRLVKLFFSVLLYVHWVGCLWLWLASYEKKNPKSWGNRLDIHDEDPVDQYITAAYWALITFATVGYGDICPVSRLEKIYTITVVFIGAAVYATIFGNMTNLIASLDVDGNRYREKVGMLNEYMRYRGLPNSLKSRIRDYYEVIWNRHKGLDEAAILDDLPPSLRSDVALYLHHHLVQKVPLFQDCDIPGFINSLVVKLQPQVALPGDYIIRHGEIGREMYFLSRGQVEVISGDGTVVYATLNEGSYFGEIALLFEARRIAHIRTTTYCDLLMLTKDDFDAVLCYFPTLMDEMRRKAKEVIGEQRMKVASKPPTKPTNKVSLVPLTDEEEQELHRKLESASGTEDGDEDDQDESDGSQTNRSIGSQDIQDPGSPAQQSSAPTLLREAGNSLIAGINGFIQAIGGKSQNTSVEVLDHPNSLEKQKAEAPRDSGQAIPKSLGQHGADSGANSSYEIVVHDLTDHDVEHAIQNHIVPSKSPPVMQDTIRHNPQLQPSSPHRTLQFPSSEKMQIADVFEAKVAQPPTLDHRQNAGLRVELPQESVLGRAENRPDSETVVGAGDGKSSTTLSSAAKADLGFFGQTYCDATTAIVGPAIPFGGNPIRQAMAAKAKDKYLRAKWKATMYSALAQMSDQDGITSTPQDVANLTPNVNTSAVVNEPKSPTKVMGHSMSSVTVNSISAAEQSTASALAQAVMRKSSRRLSRAPLVNTEREAIQAVVNGFNTIQEEENAEAHALQDIAKPNTFSTSEWSEWLQFIDDEVQKNANPLAGNMETMSKASSRRKRRTSRAPAESVSPLARSGRRMSYFQGQWQKLPQGSPLSPQELPPSQE
eukprot:TRINITY_DN7574_c0_g1_i5.p1 TRINITY_DN7574_c0_g1~~TRINITY_DN7574_c0_g1_i5.p1  ORF type:complete len:1102 (+),score=233.45 TRINITY_DN7574_c0_g1_i5:120-3425(+)